MIGSFLKEIQKAERASVYGCEKGMKESTWTIVPQSRKKKTLFDVCEVKNVGTVSEVKEEEKGESRRAGNEYI